MVWVIVILILVALFFLYRLFKIPKVGCISLVTGAVKGGKSMLSVWLSVKKYRSQRRKWRLKCFFNSFLNVFRRKKAPNPEEPLLYSNVQLAGVKFVPVTSDMILRKVRMSYGSVMYVQEASLLADSQYFKDMEVNERLLLFNKLYGHETKGGFLFYDTQSVADCHYAIKRCISSYIWIHHNIKLPFFCILYVRELFYSEDKAAINTFDDDVEETLRRIIVPKKVWRMYDAYCYSVFTDGLPVARRTSYIKLPRPFGKADLKTKRLVSVKKYKTISEYNYMQEIPEEVEKE